MTLRIAMLAFLLTMVLLAPPALRSEDSETPKTITETLRTRYPDLKILDVRPAPMPTLFEVFTGNEILYTDATANYLISGAIIDTRTKNNLSDRVIDDRNRIDFKTLPFDQAIVVTKGQGTRKLAVFTDPDCPYCKMLEKELANVNDVTIYSFLYPLAQIHPQAPAKSRAIWCSNDRARAWTHWMLEQKEPPASECKGDPVDSLQTLGQKLYIAATPTIYFESGRRLTGGMNTADMDKALIEETAIARR